MEGRALACAKTEDLLVLLLALPGYEFGIVEGAFHAGLLDYLFEDSGCTGGSAVVGLAGPE